MFPSKLVMPSLHRELNHLTTPASQLSRDRDSFPQSIVELVVEPKVVVPAAVGWWAVVTVLVGRASVVLVAEGQAELAAAVVGRAFVVRA